jgi:hypothetical protein
MPIKDYKYNSETNKHEGILDLEVQKEWVEDIVDYYIEEEEEEYIPVSKPKIITQPKPESKPLWRKIASKAKKALNEFI